MNGVVLAVHRQDLGARRFGRARHEFAAHHESLLVGECDTLTSFDRSQRRDKPDCTDGAGNDDIGVRMCRYRFEPFGIQSDLRFNDPEGTQLLFERFGASRVLDGNEIRFETRDLFGEFLHVPTGAESNDTKTAKMFDNFEGIATYRACGAKDGNAFHTRGTKQQDYHNDMAFGTMIAIRSGPAHLAGNHGVYVSLHGKVDRKSV